MDDRERKVIVFLLGVTLKLSIGIEISTNEAQQLENLALEFGTYDLDEHEFRY